MDGIIVITRPCQLLETLADDVNPFSNVIDISFMILKAVGFTVMSVISSHSTSKRVESCGMSQIFPIKVHGNSSSYYLIT